MVDVRPSARCRIRAALAGTALTAALCATLSACGGAGSPAAAPAVPSTISPRPDATPGALASHTPSPQAAVRTGGARQAQALLDRGTRKVRTARTGHLAWTARLGNVAGAVTQRASTAYDLGTDRWSGSVSIRDAVGEFAFDYAAAGSRVYVTFRQGMSSELDGRWVGLDRDAVPNLESGRAVLDALGAVHATGSRTTADGAVVRGTVPARRALALLALSGSRELAGRAIGGSAGVEVRLDRAGRIVGLTMRGADVHLTGAPASVKRAVAGSQLDVDLSGFGAPVTVRTPARWVPVEASTLPRL